jgi:N-acetylmuramic acid 6-phosphate etherase
MQIPLPPSAATESRNAASMKIDGLTAQEIVELMNSEDAKVAAAVAREATQIAKAIDVISDRFGKGGRLIYMGAGTSGRLGVLDASECPPTFSVPPGMVIGLIAGGRTALTSAIEGAEDRDDQGVQDLQNVGLTAADVVMGIASSGRTPYVLGGLQFARSVGAVTLGLACNENSAMVPLSDIMIAPIVGPEVVTGSTRLKAGTATKMVLNMLTTGAMIRIGKTYGNLMVDLTATNEKLRDRSCRIVSELTGLTAVSGTAEVMRRAGEDSRGFAAERPDAV